MSPVVQNVNDRLLYQVVVDPRRGGKRSLISSEIRSFSTRRYLIRTGSKPTDFLLTCWKDREDEQSPTDLFFFEDAIVTSTGTAMDIIEVDRNRRNLTTPQAQVFTGTTTSDDGTLLESRHLHGRDGPSAELAFILRPTTDYLVLFSGGSGDTEFRVELHEITTTPGAATQP